MLELTLIRHGITAWNAQRRFQGHTDTPLSEQGREQARRLAARLAGERIDAIVASDLSRALETARAIAAPHGIDVRTDARLRESNFGAWEGLTREEAVATGLHLRDSVRTRETERELEIPETLEQVRERVGAFVRELLEQTPDGHVAVVAHAGSIHAALRELGLSTAGLTIAHASITRLSMEPGGARLINVGDVAHLDDPR